MKHFAAILVAAGVAGAAGFYGGLAALLAVTGLSQPGWSPVAMLAGAALAATTAASLVAGLPARLVAAAAGTAAVLGAAAGLVVMQLRDGFEAAVVAGLALAAGAAIIVQRWSAARHA